MFLIAMGDGSVVDGPSTEFVKKEGIFECVNGDAGWLSIICAKNVRPQMAVFLCNSFIEKIRDFPKSRTTTGVYD